MALSKTLLSGEGVIFCHPKSLPLHMAISAAAAAIFENPVNAPSRKAASVFSPQHLALLTSKYWGAKGVHLSVQFLDSPPTDLRSKILSHMNAWAKTANVSFLETMGSGQVRIARVLGDGYWSYLGTDILSIPAGQPTMNLDSFSSSTPDAEFFRVVRHETGHTLGFPHEHLRKEVVSRIDPIKAYAYFAQYDGWDRATVDAQVLTPIDESTLQETAVDLQSIMCYQLPGSIMKDGVPVPGGLDIDGSDYAFVGKVYPQFAGPVPPPAPTPTFTLVGNVRPGGLGFIRADSQPIASGHYQAVKV